MVFIKVNAYSVTIISCILFILQDNIPFYYSNKLACLNVNGKETWHCCSCVLNSDTLRGEGEGFEGEILAIFHTIEWT